MAKGAQKVWADTATSGPCLSLKDHGTLGKTTYFSELWFS